MKIAAVLTLAFPTVLVTQAATMAANAVPAPGCPVPLPVSQVTEGMNGWGLTVSKGTTPQRFTVKVQGVLADWIAPGIDLIIVDASSPALDAAGAIWSGMSGSPVYAKNGRLIGAVSYAFSGTSKLAGLTPAQAMLDIWNRPAQARTLALKTRVQLPKELQQKIVSRDLVSAQVAAQGMEMLPLVHGVSGVSQTRIDQLNARAEQSGSDVRLIKMAATSGTPAPAGDAVPGGNFGALLSYGTVTEGAVGTTTAVCEGRALAFGHPYYDQGEDMRFAAVSGNVIAVVPDPNFGPYKMASPGGVLGTVTQDRHAGISADLGAGPPTIPVTARSSAAGATRTDTTYVVTPRYLPELAATHVWAGLDRARDRSGAGTATASWTIRGTAGGEPWQVTLGDRYVDSWDATYMAADGVYASLDILLNNKYTPVEFTDVQVTDEVNDVYRPYTVSQILIRSGDEWVVYDPANPLNITPGEDLVFKVRATGYQAPPTDVEMRVRVPEEAAGGYGEIHLVGGRDWWFDPNERAGSFSELLARMEQAPRNDVLYGTMSYYHLGGMNTTFEASVDGVIGGDISIQFTVD
ncbi:MAG TPA: SpoIVB peptidase S55 domain-containing protein [Streptosporangiaceae bacterium]|nr:SpoIVB peptidase S55 domain-containing protein [Streptosporangiaceae bacterium]